MKMAPNQELAKIITAHYVHNTYITAWGGLFTTNELRPELNINYSSIIAECFNLPQEANAIKAILTAHYPEGQLTFEKSVEVSLHLITEHCKAEGWKGSVQFNHEIISKLIAAACAINKVFIGMESMYLGDTSGCFERTCTIKTKMMTGYLCETVLTALGGSLDIEEQLNCSYLLDAPFTSTNTTKEINNRIDYLQNVIRKKKKEATLLTEK
jgi:hypothetical protein